MHIIEKQKYTWLLVIIAKLSETHSKLRNKKIFVKFDVDCICFNQKRKLFVKLEKTTQKNIWKILFYR